MQHQSSEESLLMETKFLI